MVIEIKNKQSIGIPAVRTGEDITPFVKAGAALLPAPAPNAGMFYCIIHMADLPMGKQSSDPRYCQQCYETLAKEADDMKATGNRRKAWWTPCNLATGNKRRAVVLGQVTQTQTVSVTPQNCLFCGKELTQRRKTKKFCNAACRVGANRQQTVQNDTSAKSQILKMRTWQKPNTQNEGLKK